jgi:hypothetical protein
LACDDAIEKADELVMRELTSEEMIVFKSMDAMNANDLSVTKAVLDLLIAKLRACNESSDIIYPENANNETMLMIVKHVSLKQVAEVKGKFTSRKRPVEKKSARYSMGASCDSHVSLSHSSSSVTVALLCLPPPLSHSSSLFILYSTVPTGIESSILCVTVV